MLLAAVVPTNGKQHLFDKEIDDILYFSTDTILDFLFGILVTQYTDQHAMIRFAEVDKPSALEYRWDCNHDHHFEYVKVQVPELNTTLYKLDDWVNRPVISFDLDKYLKEPDSSRLFKSLDDMYYGISGQQSEYTIVDLTHDWSKCVIDVVRTYIKVNRDTWCEDDVRWVRSWLFNNLLVDNSGETDLRFREVTLNEMFATVKYVQSKPHPVIYKDSDCIRVLELSCWTYYFQKHGLDVERAYKAATIEMENLCKGRLQKWKNEHLYTPYDKHFSQRILYKTIMNGKYNIYA